MLHKKRKFGKYTVEIDNSSIKISDEFFTNYGTIYPHIKTGSTNIYGQMFPFGMDSSIHRKDIKEWLTKTILNFNDKY